MPPLPAITVNPRKTAGQTRPAHRSQTLPAPDPKAHGRIIQSGFVPATGLRNCHAQTLWQALVGRSVQTAVHEQRWELADGDFLDLAWSDDPTQPPAADDTRPIAILLHGLEGDRHSNYIVGLTHALQQRGWRSCLMHFRNCGKQPNRLARSYHSGETSDIQRLVEHLRQQYPSAPLMVVGYSLGGNVLLKWLGEKGSSAAVAAAVAVSVPMRLDLCAVRMETGLSRLYQRHLVSKLQRSSRRKFSQRDDSPYPLDKLHQLRSFRQFDHEFTAPLHGFASGADYYQRSSSRQFLRGIQVPTLIIHAIDDPFMTPAVIPEASELAPSVTLELSEHGGHVGFISGRWPHQLHYWLDQRIPEFLAAQLEDLRAAQL